MSDTLLSEYENLIGRENLDDITDPPVLLPPNERLISEIIRKACSDNIKVTIAGKRTFPVFHNLQSDIVVSTAALSSVKEVNPEDFILLTQAGAIVDTIVGEAEKAGLFMPLDTTSGDRASIGGAYMAGAVSPSSYGYGAFRESVIGVRCITASGEIITGGGRTTKNVTGYDFTRFLAGTMGLFAIAYELTLTVRPLPESRIVVAAHFLPGSRPFDAIKEIVSAINGITMLELIAQDGLGGEITVGVGIDGMEHIVQLLAGRVQDILSTAGANDVNRNKRKTFKIERREAASTMVGPDFFTISVPPLSSEILLKRIRDCSDHIPVLGHPAIGRFHVVCKNEKHMELLQETALAVGGKYPVAWNQISQNGISCYFTETECKIVRSLKRELDPLNILNPHVKIL